MTGTPLSVGGAALWSAAAAALLGLGLTALVAIAPAAAHDAVLVGAVELLALLAVALLALRAHAPEQPLGALVGLRPTDPALPALGLLLGALLQLPAAPLRGLVERLAPTPPEALARRALLFEVTGPVDLVGTVVVVACLVPLAEELWTRGVLFGLVAPRRGRVVAAAVSVGAFLALHAVTWRELPTLMLAGGVLGLLRAVSGSLLPALALHVAFNATAVLSLVTGVASATRPLAPPPGVVALGSLGVLGALLAVGGIGRRSLAARQARQEDEP